MRRISGKNSPQVHLTENYHLIQALAAQCADQTFSTAILPRRPRKDRSVADTHRPHPRREDMSVGAVVVAHQVARRRGPRKRLGDLPGQPLGCRMPRHLEPQQLSPAVIQNQERKQAIKGQRRHNAHIDGGNRLNVISQKRLPGLRRQLRRSCHVFRDRRLGHLKAKHQKLAMDPRRAPKWVFPAHPLDHIAQAAIDLWPPCLMTRFPTPKHFETSAMPTQDGLWLNHLHRTTQARPKPRHPYEQRAITAKQSETRWCPPQSDG